MDFCEIESVLREREKPIAVVGLGYVGLPLAIALARHFSVIGFDTDEKRISNLKNGHDIHDENNELIGKVTIEFTLDPQKLSESPLVIIAVPTPVTSDNMPDLKCLESALRAVGKHLHKPSIIVSESTVYPGATEMLAEKILEKELGLGRKSQFKLGYSPERVNPGDPEHTIDKITKIIAAEDDEALSILEMVYGKITSVYPAKNIATAEAAKVIENIQRDINIALVNELALVFDRIGLDTTDVINAASTKWNFHPYKPGLVGGHCISVDPYYLSHLAESLGYTPRVILAGRRLNSGMGEFIANTAMNMLIDSDKELKGARVAILGITFKENVTDIRNSGVISIINRLKESMLEVYIVDPLALPSEVEKRCGMKLSKEEDISDVDVIIMAVPHEQFLERAEAEFLKFAKNGEKKPIFIDIKSAYSSRRLPAFNYWRL